MYGCVVVVCCCCCHPRFTALKWKLNTTLCLETLIYACLRHKFSFSGSFPVDVYLRKKEKKTDTRPVPVADGWAGAKMRVSPLSQLDDLNGETNRRTNRRTKPLIESLVRDLQNINQLFPFICCSHFIFSRVHATLHPALSVRRSVRPPVHPSHFTFFGFLRFLASLLLPK